MPLIDDLATLVARPGLMAKETAAVKLAISFVKCQIKCDWRGFVLNYVRLAMPHYLRLGTI